MSAEGEYVAKLWARATDEVRAKARERGTFGAGDEREFTDGKDGPAFWDEVERVVAQMRRLDEDQ